MTHWTLARVCVPTYMRNTYPGVGSVLRAIIACRPEDSLRPVLSYPSSSLAIVPRQTHDHNPSFPFHLPDSLSRSGTHESLSHPYRFSLSLFRRGIYLSDLLFFFGFSSLIRREHLPFQGTTLRCYLQVDLMSKRFLRLA